MTRFFLWHRMVQQINFVLFVDLVSRKKIGINKRAQVDNDQAFPMALNVITINFVLFGQRRPVG